MKLNVKQTILIGLSFASILSFWQFYDQVIPEILEAHFGCSTYYTNAIMSIDNVLAIFMLPLFGAISDKTRSRLGRRTPYILFGTAAATILMAAMAIMTEKASFAGFFVCLLLLLVVMSVYRSPAVAYMPDVTPKPLRSKGNAVINLVGYVGGIFSTIVMGFLVTSRETEQGRVYNSFVPIFAAVAAFMLITVLIMVLTLNENKIVREANIRDERSDNSNEPKTAENKGEKLSKPVFTSLIFILLSVFLWFTAYNGVTTSFSRYFRNRYDIDAGDSAKMLTVATVAAIVSFVPLGIISSKLGRKKTVLAGILMMTVCYGAMFFLETPGVAVYAILAVVGIGWAAINVNSFPMVVEMCQSSDVGKYTGYYYAFSMAAQIFTPLLSGKLIEKLGYTVLFPYAVVFSALSFVTMLMVRHGDSKPETKKSLLENFDVDD